MISPPPTEPIARCTFASPLGPLELRATPTALCGIHLPTEKRPPPPLPPEAQGEDPAHPVLRLAREQLAQYFAGQRQVFELPLAPRGSPFQQRVWRQLLAIPFGTSTSYGALARTLGHPRASRAVGAANARNPLPIVVPCHRVIGANGHLTGYAGGEPAKRWLLDHESRAYATSPGAKAPAAAADIG